MNLEKIFGGELTKTKEILFYSAIACIVIILLGVVLSFIFSNINILLNFLVIGIFVLLLPTFIYKYMHFVEIKNCEKYFPIFLNDLREAKKSGVSLPEAIRSCRGEYGKLEKYVDKLKKDISWGVNIDDAFNYMKKRLNESDLITKAISVLVETYRSGGNIEGIIRTLINSLMKIIESENYRKNTMQQHVLLMYVIFLMYIGLVIALGNFLIPLLLDVSKIGSSGSGEVQILTASSPCESCGYRIFCFGLCKYYNTVGGMFGFGEENSLEVYYKSLFLTMILVQGFFTGLIAGQISAKSWIEGAKHGILMFFIGLFIILLTNTIGFF